MEKSSVEKVSAAAVEGQGQHKGQRQQRGRPSGVLHNYIRPLHDLPLVRSGEAPPALGEASPNTGEPVFPPLGVRLSHLYT